MIRLKGSKRKSTATVPRNFSGQEKIFADSVVESLDSLAGRRGDLTERAVTFKDLLDANILRLASGQTLTGGGVNPILVNPTDPTNGGGDVEIPPAPSNLTVTGGFGFVRITWNMASYRGFGSVEIYRHPSDDIAAATAEGPDLIYGFAGNGSVDDTIVGSGTTYYYWVRGVNTNGVAGPFNSSAGTSATTPIDYAYISGLIDDILVDDLDALGLNTISKLDQDIADLNSVNAWSSSVNYIKDDMVTHTNKIWKALVPSSNQEPSATNSSRWEDVGNYTNLASFVSATQTQNSSTLATLDSNYYTKTGTESAISSADLTLNSDFDDLKSDLDLNYYTKTTADTATATAIGNFTTSVNGNTATLQQTAESVDGTQAKFSVKIDNNDHVSGFGLISTANNGTPTSAFIVAADRFAVAAPFNASATANNNIGETEFPFKVFSTNHTLTDDAGNNILDAEGNNVVIPAGAYIDDAFIHEAQITSATIGTATITTANIASGAITSATVGDFIESTGFAPLANVPVEGWRLQKTTSNGIPSGTLWATNAIIKGNITATNLTLSAAARIKTLQINGDAVTVPVLIEYGKAFPSAASEGNTSTGKWSNWNATTSDLGDLSPEMQSGAVWMGKTAYAEGGRILVTGNLLLQTNKEEQNLTTELLVTCVFGPANANVYSVAQYGSMQTSFRMGDIGSTRSNITVPVSFTGSTNQKVGTYNALTFDYDGSDAVVIKTFVKAKQVTILSGSLTVMSCKR